jgi:hypothetical protein
MVDKICSGNLMGGQCSSTGASAGLAIIDGTAGGSAGLVTAPAGLAIINSTAGG